MTAGVEGLGKAQAAMKRLTPEMARKIDGALDKGAQEVSDRAAAIAPKDSGELAGAIEVRSGLDGLSGRQSAFVRRIAGRTGGELVRIIGVFAERRGSPGWYAPFVELGTKKKARRPFLRPAFVTLRRRVQGRVARAVNAAAKEVARRG